ncbi:MAG: GTP-binding protein [Oscillospiraceae bacterium]|jgi:ribosomal protection tetracycline resistance protein
MYTTIGVLAHVDAGKTTLSEQLLYHAGALRTAGRVDQKNAFLDYDAIERERGITIFSDQASFTCGERVFQLIDTPGHVDFSGEMERCLGVMDCAVLVISAAEGIQSHTETIWRLLEEHRIPTFLFLNKIDRAGADPDAVLHAARREWKLPCLDITKRLFPDRMAETLVEEIAELEDSLLETYLSSGYDFQGWLAALRRMVAARSVVPVLSGSALNGDGIDALMQALAQLAPVCGGDPGGALLARAYKVRHDKQGGRVVYLKVLNGTLHPKDSLPCHPPNTETVDEKINELRCYNGGKYRLMDQAAPGMLCAVTGITTLMPGDWAGQAEAGRVASSLQPLLAAQVLFDPSIHPKTMLECLRVLEDEEPLLGVVWEEELQQIQVHIMGPIQLEVLTEVVQERFGYSIRFGPCEILYRETIAAPVVGCGHFEPLRHYAEVHLRLEPAARDSGIRFASECPTDSLAANWQNLVRTHIFEKEHRGVLTGAPLTDVRITLLAGRAHLKHTEGGDFREATYRAIRQGLMHAQNILLEPWYRFTIQAEIALTGRILSDIQRMNGRYEPPETGETTVTIHGRAPVACMMGYSEELTAFTKGKGRLSLAFDGYEPCHNANEIIAQKGYEPERDLANTPDSVFCSHGAGYPVKWDQAAAHMHIKL